MAVCGRALPWIQKSESHPFTFDRTSAHSLRHSHASGGGEIVCTSGCCASAEKSGGARVVQETYGLSNELESKPSLIVPSEKRPHVTLVPKAPSAAMELWGTKAFSYAMQRALP